MNKVQVLMSIAVLSLVSIVRADDTQSNSQAQQDRMKNRQEKIHARIEKHCNGDQKCEADMREKFQQRREEVKAEVQKECPAKDDTDCRKQAIQKIRADFKAKRQEAKQNSSVKPS